VANHITINGQTYSSVGDMPPDVRRQYEAAMQLVAKNGAAASAAAGDVSINTTGGDPMAPLSKTLTEISARRIVVNGKEYDRWEDVPQEARAAFQAVGVNPQMPFARAARRAANASQIANAYQLNSSSFRISISPATLVIVVIFILLIGIFLGYLLS